jgi:predicted nucleic acid-binding protein
VITYVDSSVLLRVVFGQADALPGWSDLGPAIASELIVLECSRALDRLRLRGRITDDDVATLHQATAGLLAAIEQVDLTRAVLRRAAEPMPTELGALDAVHLATALLWRSKHGGPEAFATHDRALGLAARASGFRVLGLA